MKKNNQYLDELMKALAKDAPQFDRTSLRAIIAEPSTAPASILQKPTTPSKTGILIMSTVLILLSALASLFYFNNTTVDSPKPISQTTQPSITSTLNAPVDAEPLNTKPSDNWLDTVGLPSYEPVDLSNVVPYVLPESDFYKIGIAKDDRNTIFAYHLTGKFIFPSDSVSTNTYDTKDDPLVKTFGSMGIFPSFATDVNGNLILMYEYQKNGGNSTMSVAFPEAMSKQNLARDYYPITSYSSKNIRVDSSKIPFRELNNIILRAGIMKIDTQLWFTVGDQRDNAYDPTIKQLMSRAIEKDSVFKMSFGDERELTRLFDFSSQHKVFPERSFEGKLIKSIDNVALAIKNPKEKVRATIKFLDSLIVDNNISDTSKLKVEQLSRHYQYEEYLLGKEEEKVKIASMNQLIPILVRPMTGLKLDENYNNGLILWYQPSERLRSALPSLATVTSQQKQKNLTMRTSVFPNPALRTGGSAFIKTDLAESAILTVDMFDISGKLVQQIMITGKRAKGSYTDEFSIRDIKSGMYVLRITTDNGDQRYERLIIQ